MPTEPLPWDRREFRKHERSGSDSRFGGGGFGGGGGVGAPHKWRAQQQQPTHSPPLYHQNQHHQQQQQRWYSDFRSPRLLPPGQGKQGGWHMYSDDASQGFLSLGSHYGDRNAQDENCRPSVVRGDGRYFRNNRENKGFFTQKDRKSSPFSEAAVSPIAPAKLVTEINNLRSIEKKGSFTQKDRKSSFSEPAVLPSAPGKLVTEVNNLRSIENKGSFAEKDRKSPFLKPAVSPSVSGKPITEVNNSRFVENKGSFTERSPLSEPAVSPSSPGKPITEVNNLRSIENRGSFTGKDRKSPCLEPAVSPSAPGKPITELNNLRSIENTRPCHNSSNSRSSYTSHPPSNSVNLSDQSQSVMKEKNNKNCGTAIEMTSTGQESGRENCLGSVDWKSLKWIRLGSLSSRGSCFSHSSSSKSVGEDSTEILADMQPKNTTLVQSPSTDAACNRSSVPAEFDEYGTRKKRRLGWGEGLAKYEKKKVEGSEDGAPKNEVILGAVNAETLHSQPVNLPEKSPRVASMSDCASPATPSSVAFSSSPGIVQKESDKEANVDQDTTNLSSSPSIVSQTHYDGPIFNLENLELASIANLSSLINELLQFNDPTAAEAGYMRTTSLNKLLVWKVDLSKAVEMMESEIESLEAELKSLIAEPRICCPGSSLLPGEDQLKPCEGLGTVSKCGTKLDVDSSGENNGENAPVGPEDVHILSKDEDIDRPGSVSSKSVEVLPAISYSERAVFTEGSTNLDVNNSSNLDEKCRRNGLNSEENSEFVDKHVLIGTTTPEDLTGVSNVHYDVDNIYETIISSNRDAASRAMEQLNKLLPAQCLPNSSIESSVSSLQTDPSLVKKFLMRKQFIRFKEKVLTLKFKVFQHFWKQGRIISIRKLRGKAQKKFDPSRNAHKRKHASTRSRVSSYAGVPQTVPADEVIEYVNHLLSELPFKPYRNTLKMPALILDKAVKTSRFISNNGLVEDPCAVEKERSMINPWTSEEKEIFLDKLAVFGKDFTKIASFLDHKTVADCVEFYYKNRKSKCFEKRKKNSGFSKQSKSQSTTYLVGSGKRRNPELNTVSLDILGAASEIVANIDNGMGASGSCKAPRGDDGLFQGSNSMNTYSNERETEAADVLASICGSLSSEAMSSCITSSADHPGDGYQDPRGLRIGSSTKRPLTPEVTQDVDDECSDESYGELNPTDWSDEEKSMFIQAMSIYGKDFVMISQYVRTRSIDQCKLFFSKARNCLGLDRIQPGDGTASDDVNGDGSDIDDGCTLETGSVICNDGSECKMDEDPPPPDMKSSHDSDVAWAQSLRPDYKISEGNNELGPNYSGTAEPVFENSAMVGNHGDDKPVTDFNVQSKGQSASDVAVVSTQECQTAEVSSDKESKRGLIETEKAGLVEVSDGRHGQENQQQGPLLPEGNSDNKMVEDKDANLSEVSHISSGISKTKSEPQPSGDVSHPSVDAHSSMQVDKVSEYQKKADIETFSTESSRVSSLHQNGRLASMTSSTLFSVPIEYQKTPNHNALLAVDANARRQKTSSTVDCQQHLPGRSLSDSMESSLILRGYPVSLETMKEINGDVDCENLTALPNASKRYRSLNSNQHTDFFLEKSNESKQSKVVEAPFPSLEQRHQSGCSSAGEKPSRKGDVKLFGTILVSSEQKTNNSIEQPDDNSSLQYKISRETLNLKLGADQKANFDSMQSKFDSNTYVGAENIPVGSFGFWDGNRIQTAIPRFPDSALLLTKYPAAFSNYALPKAQLEQPPLHGTVKTFPMNVLHSTELSNSNILANYQGVRNRELQPFTMDMKQRQDMFAEMQRRNMFNVVSGMQGGMSRINVVGRQGVFARGQCSNLSDPVAALKMHYANAEQLRRHHQR